MYCLEENLWKKFLNELVIEFLFSCLTVFAMSFFPCMWLKCLNLGLLWMAVQWQNSGNCLICSLVKRRNVLRQQIQVVSLWMIKPRFIFSPSTQPHWKVRGCITDLHRKQPSSSPQFLNTFIFIQLTKMSNILM